MTKAFLAFFTAATSLLSACATEQHDAARTEIAGNVQRFVAAFNRGDAVAVAALYTTDALVRLQGAPEAYGRAPITAFWQHGIGTGKRLKLDTTEVSTGGNFAYEIGHATVTTADGSIEAAKKYLVVWRKDAAGWRLHRDFANSAPSAPPAPPAS